MEKENVVYIHNEILFSQKKEGNSANCDNIGRPEGIMLSGWQWLLDATPKAPSMKEEANNLDFTEVKNCSVKDIVKRKKNKSQTGRKFLRNTYLIKDCYGGFPGGAVVKNLPANAGDMGLSPGPGRSHMPWSN